MDPFTGEIRMFGFDYSPTEWAFCDGQLVSIAQFSALAAVIGTTYGGDGRTTVGLPNLQSRTLVGATSSNLGYVDGTETVTLTTEHIPPHNHTVMGEVLAGQQTGVPNSAVVPSQIVSGTAQSAFSSNNTPNCNLAASTITATGGYMPHENRQPFLALNLCICLYGYFPTPAN